MPQCCRPTVRTTGSSDERTYGHRRHRGKPYAGRPLLTVVQVLLVLGALFWLVVGPVYWINSITRAGDAIDVYVALDARTPTGEAAPSGADLLLIVPLELPEATAARLTAAAAQLSADDDGLNLSADDSTLAEQALAGGDVLLVALSTGVGLLLVRRVVHSISTGHPFEAGNARRIAWVAVAVGAGAFIAPLLQTAAAALVLGRLGLGDAGDAGGSLSPVPGLDLIALLAVAVLLALAEAFRHGERLRREADGLV